MSTFQLQCRFHPDAELIDDHRAGDVICSSCGLVVGDRMIDVSAEWREFGNDSETKSMSRVGAAENLLFGFNTFETKVLPGNTSEVPKLNPKTSQMSSAEKLLRTGHSTIRTISDRLGLTKRVTDRAYLIFESCYKNKFLRGRSRDAVLAACIFSASRQEGSTRTIQEICGASPAELKEVRRYYLQMQRLIPKKDNVKAIDIKDLIPRFCNNLNLEDNRVQKTAIHIVERVYEVCDVQGRAPRSIASAAIYMACAATQQTRLKKDIQNVTAVSESAIRTIYKMMLPHASKLLPDISLSQCRPATLPSS